MEFGLPASVPQAGSLSFKVRIEVIIDGVRNRGEQAVPVFEYKIGRVPGVNTEYVITVRRKNDRNIAHRMQQAVALLDPTVFMRDFDGVGNPGGNQVGKFIIFQQVNHRAAFPLG